MSARRFRQLLVLVALGSLLAAGAALVGAVVESPVLLIAGLLGVLSVLVALGGVQLILVRRQLEASRELDRVLAQVQKANRRLGRQPGSVEARLRHHVIRDVAALLTLHDMHPTPGEHVPLTSFSALPATALLLAERVRELPPGARVVELGSGATTLWMALAARRSGGGVSIVSLESSADFAEVTRRALRRNGVDDLVEVRVAELLPVTTARGDQLWYADAAWADLDDIGLLFVDGPPGATGAFARYPAVELLAPRMASGGIVVMDDTDRDDEGAIVDDWRALERGGAHPEIVEERERTIVLRLP